jgi:neutral ceramidase
VSGGRRLGLLAPLLGLAAGCAGWHAQLLPEPLSPIGQGTGWLRAGAASVDITPPPGVGLGGSGPEGPRSTGYRTRLFAHALLLEDATGERIALVVADLAHVPANLHRLAAERLVGPTGIGADRLIVSATHTHSGPAHFYGERQYNGNVSRIGGYDPRMVDFLVTRIVAAVERAHRTLGPAVAAVGTVAVHGASLNRSIEAYCENPESRSTPACAPPFDRLAAVDPQLLLLRVDRRPPGGRPTPLASYGVFAIHGTAQPSLNSLLDGDVHARIVRRLAAHADSIPGAGATVHALANGNEGDMAPAVRRSPSCGTPRLDLADRFLMPRGPGPAVDFIDPAPDRVRRCLDTGVAEIDRVAALVAGRAIQLYDSLRAELTGTFPIRRAFATEWLPGRDSLCIAAVAGSATAAGADGAETRVRGWRWLLWPLLKLGIEEGGSAVRAVPGSCQSPKRELLEPFQTKLVVGEHGFPSLAQLTVLRVGPALLAAVPAEVTVVAGRRMRDAMAAAASTRGWRPAATALIGLANGFLQYVTTAEEYGWQSYEGGSTLYGPGSAGFLTRRIAALAATLEPGMPSPSAVVGPMAAYPGPPEAIMPLPSQPPERVAATRIVLACRAGRLEGTWLDVGPGRILPRDSTWVQLVAEGDADPVARDGDGWLEVHLGRRRSGGFEWRAEWLGTPARGTRYRLERLSESGRAVARSEPVACPGGATGGFPGGARGK